MLQLFNIKYNRQIWADSLWWIYLAMSMNNFSEMKNNLYGFLLSYLLSIAESQLTVILSSNSNKLHIVEFYHLLNLKNFKTLINIFCTITSRGKNFLPSLIQNRHLHSVASICVMPGRLGRDTPKKTDKGGMDTWFAVSLLSIQFILKAKNQIRWNNETASN